MTRLSAVHTRYQANTARAPARLAQQCRYIGRVPLFDRLLETPSITDARRLIAAYGLAPAWTGPVAYHRLIISLHRETGLGDVALVQALTTVALDDLGAILQRRPVWIGGVHTDTENTHAHILLAGGDQRGRSVEIRGKALATFKGQVETRARALMA